MAKWNIPTTDEAKKHNLRKRIIELEEKHDKLLDALKEAVGWNWLDDNAESTIPGYSEILRLAGITESEL